MSINEGRRKKPGGRVGGWWAMSDLLAMAGPLCGVGTNVSVF